MKSRMGRYIWCKFGQVELNLLQNTECLSLIQKTTDKCFRKWLTKFVKEMNIYTELTAWKAVSLQWVKVIRDILQNYHFQWHAQQHCKCSILP